jgi:hypothetical protein
MAPLIYSKKLLSIKKNKYIVINNNLIKLGVSLGNVPQKTKNLL